MKKEEYKLIISLLLQEVDDLSVVAEYYEERYRLEVEALTREIESLRFVVDSQYDPETEEPEEVKPFPRVGAWIKRAGHDNLYHRQISSINGGIVEYKLYDENARPTGDTYTAPVSDVTEVENPFED